MPAQGSRADREALATKRLLRVIGAHGAAISRTLEMKIADAGPFDQRIDPHILNPVRNQLVNDGALLKIKKHSRDWYVLPDTPKDWIEERIAAQFDVLRLTLDNKFPHRIGDTLEVTVYRALQNAGAALSSLGGFRGLTDAPTEKTPKKEEPPSIFSGRELQGNKRFDFLVGTTAWAGVECKNIREWLYPDRPEIKDMLQKSVELDIPSILVARRIPFVTRRVLQPAGIRVWQVYNQLYPSEYDNLAALMKDKTLLGFHDIRVNEHPDKRLQEFFTRIIPEELPKMRTQFDSFKDLLAAYANGDLTYTAFAARVRRREQGTNEDRDEDESEPSENSYFEGWDE